MNYNYYYNNVPGTGLCRNNLIYTSLMSDDKKVFVQWYFNDGEYHKGQNEVVDPELMEQKFNREVKYLKLMTKENPDLVPEILDIDLAQRKIYLKVDGPDFWECAGCDAENFNSVLPDWQEQMLNIVQAHRNLGLYKYSMHPSSYFVVDGKLKSINYFFTYQQNEPAISIEEHTSHIYSTRQAEMKKVTDSMGISWTDPQPFDLLQTLCWESFRKNYPNNFIEKVKCIK